MMGREPLPTLGNVSWHLAGHYKIIVHNPKMGEHGPNIDPRWARWANIDVQGHFCDARPRQDQSFGEKMLRRDSVMRPCWPLGRAFLESILQHDPKTIQMDLMNDGSGASSDPRERFLAPRRPLDPSLPRHGRCWAKPIQSGHAVQRKRCGSLNLSFSYWEAALNRRPFFQPSRSVSWNLAGHWREPSGAHRGCARPRQDSAFSEK